MVWSLASSPPSTHRTHPILLYLFSSFFFFITRLYDLQPIAAWRMVKRLPTPSPPTFPAPSLFILCFTFLPVGGAWTLNTPFSGGARSAATIASAARALRIQISRALYYYFYFPTGLLLGLAGWTGGQRSGPTRGEDAGRQHGVSLREGRECSAASAASAAPRPASPPARALSPEPPPSLQSATLYLPGPPYFSRGRKAEKSLRFIPGNCQAQR